MNILNYVSNISGVKNEFIFVLLADGNTLEDHSLSAFSRQNHIFTCKYIYGEHVNSQKAIKFLTHMQKKVQAIDEQKIEFSQGSLRLQIRRRSYEQIVDFSKAITNSQ